MYHTMVDFYIRVMQCIHSNMLHFESSVCARWQNVCDMYIYTYLCVLCKMCTL